jgi:hypothetical protein
MQTYQMKKGQVILTINIVMTIVLSVVIILKYLILEKWIASVIAMTRGYCCFQCGHCTDEVIAEMMDCKCKCHG